MLDGDVETWFLCNLKLVSNDGMKATIREQSMSFNPTECSN